MKIKLSKPIIGYKKVNEFITETRVHADEGSELSVILNNLSHFICDSVHYPGSHIAVFPSQCDEIIREEVIQTDEHDIEKYYHVYESTSKKNLDDPFYTAFESEDPE